MEKSNLKAFIIIVIALLAPLLAYYYMNKAPDDDMSTFRECTNAGYTILDGTPRKCVTPDKKVYLETTAEKNCTNLCGDGRCQRGACEETEKTCPGDCAGPDEPNNASIYCIRKGGRTTERMDENGSKYGVCVLKSGKECDEWAYYRGECVEEEKGVERGIDYSCNADSDCMIKSIQAECGQYSLCVNKKYEPQTTEEKNAGKGTCGNEEIDGCLCLEGSCIGTLQGEKNIN
jgi:hypothetical protein